MTPITQPVSLESPPWPISPSGIPIIYEDEDEEDMGEASYHYWAGHIAFTCLTAFLKETWPDLKVFNNLNCYYAREPRDPKSRSLPCFSADLMIVRPSSPTPWDFDSYTIGQEGPAPEVVVEVMSAKTAGTRDLGAKLIICSKLGIKEYILVDPTGQFLAERLLLKQLQAEGDWKNLANEDGSVTSELGFRLVIDENGELAVFHARTGKRYVRPQEAEAQADARRMAEEALGQAEARALAETEARRLAQARIQALEEELKKLRQPPATS